MVMADVIGNLKNYNTRMKTAISELERLEADEEFLDEIVKCYRDIVNRCEHQREVIQRRKYGR